MAPKISKLPGGSTGQYYGRQAEKFGTTATNNYMIGITTYKDCDYIKFTKLEKKRSKANEVSIPMDLMRREILPQFKIWQGKAAVAWQFPIEMGGKALIKASEKEDFHTTINMDDNGEDDVIVRHQEFVIAGQKTSVFASVLFIRYDEEENERYQQPIPAFVLSKSPGSDYQQMVDFHGWDDIDLMIKTTESFMKKQKPIRKNQALKRKSHDDGDQVPPLKRKKLMIADDDNDETKKHSSNDDDEEMPPWSSSKAVTTKVNQWGGGDKKKKATINKSKN
jgi:hypothetical protein